MVYVTPMIKSITIRQRRAIIDKCSLQLDSSWEEITDCLYEKYNLSYIETKKENDYYFQGSLVGEEKYINWLLLQI